MLGHPQSMSGLSVPKSVASSILVVFVVVLVGVESSAIPQPTAVAQNGVAVEKGAASDKFAQALARLRAEQDTFLARMAAVVLTNADGSPREYQGKDWEGAVTDTVQQAVPQMDAALKECLLAALGTFADMGQVSRALENLAVLREVPAGTFSMVDPIGHPLPGVDMPLSAHLSDRDKLPLVLYWPVTGKSGARVYVIMHSLLRPMGRWARGMTVPYAITVSSTGSSLSEIPELQRELTLSFESGLYPPMFFDYFLDSVDNGRDYPTLITIHYGLARETDVMFYRLDFDPESRRWKLTGRGSLPGEGRIGAAVYYDAETQSLHYDQYSDSGEGTAMTFNVRDWVLRGSPAR